MTKFLSILTPFFLLGCGIAYNAHSGSDETRGSAEEVALESLLYDRISAEEGDHSDWKSFKLEEKSSFTLLLWWDEPENIKGQVTLYDPFGKELLVVPHEKAKQHESLGPIDLPEGRYFLRFEAEEGSTVYSYKLTTIMQSLDDALPDL